MGDGHDEVERAARRRREREAAKAAAEPSPDALDADRTRRAARIKRHRVAEALAEAGWAGKVSSYVALCVGLFGPMAVAIVLTRDLGLLVLAGTVVASMVCAFMAMQLHESMLAALRRRRLYAIGRGFDADAYLAALAENRQQATVVVRVTFTRPWPEDVRASARDAVLEWMPTLVRVEWSGGALELASTEISGTKWYSGGDAGSSDRMFNNAEIHACFQQIVRRVVPRLEAVEPIARLSVAIEGKVEDFDADA